MTPDILIAQELRELLPADPVPERTVSWVAADQPTPAGEFVAFVPLLSRPVGDAAMAGMPQLKIIANCATGVDNIDVAAARRRGVVVTNTPDVLTESTADLTWALILAVARRLKEAQVFLASGQWRGWDPTGLLGLELKGRILGIIGAGRIGQAVGRRAVPFGMRIRYTAGTAKPDFEASTGAVRVELPRLLAESDVVTLHARSTAENKGFMSRPQFETMKPDAIFINTARGDLVDEAALIAGLSRGKPQAAGLDVFAREPAVPKELIEHPRVVALPHIGSATWDTRRAMAGLAVRNVRAVLAGDQPLTPVP